MTDADGVYIMRQFFLSVHPSIEEAAKIDGAYIFRTFWSVVQPMVCPQLMTLTILSFQGSWNNFSTVLRWPTSRRLLDTLTTGVGRLVSGQPVGRRSVAALAISTLSCVLATFTRGRRYNT